MRLSGQLQTSFFFAKIFRAYKNENQTNHSVRSFYVAFLKIVAFFIFCSLNFILLVGFGLICVFVRAKSFRKKKLVWGCPNYLILLYYWCVPLSTHLSRVCLYPLTFICDHLWWSLIFMRIFLTLLLFIIICVDLFF